MTAERLMVAFAGTSLPDELASALRVNAFAGVTLFRDHNVESIGQVRALTTQLQAAARADSRPLLIATDQEGGQLNALGEGPTQFAGAMALGATGDVELAERVARATGRELRALGVNVDYAPVCDLATTPDNPALGIRSFGDEPQAVAALAGATVRGLLAEGVAASAKHFPGAGDSTADTHLGLATVEADAALIEERELVPFRAAIEAGAQLVMAGHVCVPALTGDDELPASLSAAVLHDLLRDRLGFEGLTITDALDMRALAQGAAQIVDVITAVRAGEDLMLGTADSELIERLEQGLAQAQLRGLVDRAATAAVAGRLAGLRDWISSFAEPGLEVVGCAEHRALATELAMRSVTLVRNDDGLLPLRPGPETRIAVVGSPPTRITPADTSDTVRLTLADAVRRRWPLTDEIVTSPEPEPAELAEIRNRLELYDLIVNGSAAAHLRPSQAELARAVLAAGKPTVSVALRTPWDLCAYESARTYICTYGILEPSMEALAAVLFGERSPTGRLPVHIGNLHPRGHGLSLDA